MAEPVNPNPAAASLAAAPAPAAPFTAPVQPAAAAPSSSVAPLLVPGATEAAAASAAPAAADKATPSAAATSEASTGAQPLSVLGQYDKTQAEIAAAAAAKSAEAAKAAEPEPKAAEAAKPAEAKPAEAKAAEQPKPEDAKPAEFATIEYKYTVPEVIKLDDARKTELHAAFDDFRKDPNVGVQKLLDMHAKAMGDYAAQVAKQQRDVFNATKAGWTKDVLGSEDLGGAGHLTAMGAIARVRDRAISDAAPGTKQFAADMKAFQELDEITGVGSHPTYLRMLHRLARYVDEPQAKDIPTDIRPPKNNGRAPKGSLYTHPTSQNMDR